jgi:hypothetical protein
MQESCHFSTVEIYTTMILSLKHRDIYAKYYENLSIDLEHIGKDKWVWEQNRSSFRWTKPGLKYFKQIRLFFPLHPHLQIKYDRGFFRKIICMLLSANYDILWIRGIEPSGSLCSLFISLSVEYVVEFTKRTGKKTENRKEHLWTCLIFNPGKSIGSGNQIKTSHNHKMEIYSYKVRKSLIFRSQQGVEMTYVHGYRIVIRGGKV